MNSTDLLRNSVDDIGVAELESRCGTEFLTINYLLDDVADKLVVLEDSADRTFDLISCESINPIYVNTFHKALCAESASGLSWMFASLMVISICGMTMLTLRSALFEDITLNDYGEMADLQHMGQADTGNSDAAYSLRSQKSSSNSKSNSRSTGRDDPPEQSASRTMPSRSQSGSGDDDYVYPPVVLKPSRS